MNEGVLVPWHQMKLTNKIHEKNHPKMTTPENVVSSNPFSSDRAILHGISSLFIQRWDCTHRFISVHCSIRKKRSKKRFYDLGSEWKLDYCPPFLICQDQVWFPIAMLIWSPCYPVCGRQPTHKYIIHWRPDSIITIWCPIITSHITGNTKWPSQLI